MGKPKNQPRIKVNVQPASSSRAAEIIATGGSQVPIVNLGGFAQFLGGYTFSTDTSADKMADVNLDPTLSEGHLDVFSSTYLMKIFNKEISVCGDLWDSLLVFTKSFPESWLLASKKKPMLPNCIISFDWRIMDQYLSHTPSILILVSLLPQELINTDPKFYDEFLSNFWKGLSTTTIDRSNFDIDFLKLKPD
ncbi:11310_t:CDS:2 [Scutellospora calospora]|uniref:11310_t:CDS:1 n=1 Tax=Scutellospora calospora TaxID=85575 RepID=A0ACA9JTQ1_9GLOM|nr:11310_t:CDS:2 [Scutellospora calospora]